MVHRVGRCLGTWYAILIFLLGGGLHRLQLVGCPKYPIFFPFDMFSYALRGSNMLGRCARTLPSRRVWLQRTASFCFPKRLWGHLCKIPVVDISVLKAGACARLAGDFAKALLEIQDAKQIAPAPAQFTATLLGTTAWWKLWSYC